LGLPVNPIDGPDAFNREFSVSRETVDRLEVYVDLLRRWQKSVNLVAPNTLDDVWHRHIADSAQLWPLIPARAARLVDLGSGAGFPGLVLAILARPRPHPLAVTLVEADQRKAAFLREAARLTSTPVDILCARIEAEATQIRLKPADIVTARALAPLSDLLGMALPALSMNARGLFLKGRQARQEIEDAGRHWTFSHTLVPSRTDAEASIVDVSLLRRKD
jgi:16S rRNA (guanine527-N7)-methyltransferase